MTTTRRALCKAFIKAVDEEQGRVTKYVSIFGNVDLVGDRIKYGAFATSLEEWAASGDPIPVIFSHQWNVLDAHVGYVVDAKEVPAGDPDLPPEIAEYGGLRITEQYDLDHPPAKRLFDLQKQRRIRESSFAYDVVNEAKARDGANELLELKLIEVGPTLKGANPLTQLLDAKSAGEQRAARDDAKAWVRLAGSLEEQQEQVLGACQDWAREQLGDDYYHAALEATYADSVVFYAERWSDPYGGGDYYEAGLERDGDGAVTLVDPHMVTLTATVAPKAMQAVRWAKAAKAGARNSAADTQRIQDVHDLALDLGATCPDAAGDTGASSADAEPKGHDAAHFKALTDLALAELDAGL